MQELIRHIHNLLWLMIVLNFSDGLQCVLTGVLQVPFLAFLAPFCIIQMGQFLYTQLEGHSVVIDKLDSIIMQLPKCSTHSGTNATVSINSGRASRLQLGSTKPAAPHNLPR